MMEGNKWWLFFCCFTLPRGNICKRYSRSNEFWKLWKISQQCSYKLETYLAQKFIYPAFKIIPLILSRYTLLLSPLNFNAFNAFSFQILFLQPNSSQQFTACCCFMTEVLHCNGLYHQYQQLLLNHLSNLQNSHSIYPEFQTCTFLSMCLFMLFTQGFCWDQWPTSLSFMHR